MNGFLRVCCLVVSEGIKPLTPVRVAVTQQRPGAFRTYEGSKVRQIVRRITHGVSCLRQNQDHQQNLPPLTMCYPRTGSRGIEQQKWIHGQYMTHANIDM